VTLERLRWSVSDCLIVAGRNMRHFTRQPQLLLFSTVQPIMFVILFSFVFGGAVGESLPRGVGYLEFLLPGIFVQSVAFRASQTAIGLTEDLQRGVIDRFRSMPMARSAVVAGRTIADLVRNILVILLMAGVGYAIGFRFQEGAAAAAGSIMIVGLFSFALSWIFVLVGLTAKVPEAAQSAGLLAIFPLVFASSIFVPVSTMPDWLESFARISPVTSTVDAARALAIGGEVAEPLLYTVLWTVGIMLVFVPLCVWRYRRLQ
jgi:ABC transporter DrrB family efflux protein